MITRCPIFLFLPVLSFYFCCFRLGGFGSGFQPIFPIGSFSEILWVREQLAYDIYKCLSSLICLVTVETKSKWEPELKTNWQRLNWNLNSSRESILSHSPFQLKFWTGYTVFFVGKDTSLKKKSQYLSILKTDIR